MSYEDAVKQTGEILSEKVADISLGELDKRIRRAEKLEAVDDINAFRREVGLPECASVEYLSAIMSAHRRKDQKAKRKGKKK